MTGTGDRPFVVVTVGTDHHRFDRLLDWVRHWLETVGDAVECVFQHGSTPLGASLTGHSLMPHDEMLQLLGRADLIVAQGGPGSIMDARACGVLPIVVPRLAALHEVVDDHQVSFCRRMAEIEYIALAEDEPALHALLDRGLSAPDTFRVSAASGHVKHTVETFAQLVAHMVQPTQRTRRPLAQRRHP